MAEHIVSEDVGGLSLQEWEDIIYLKDLELKVVENEKGGCTLTGHECDVRGAREEALAQYIHRFAVRRGVPDASNSQNGSIQI